MSGAMAQQHAPTPSLAPESIAMAAEAKYEQVRQSCCRLESQTEMFTSVWEAI